MRRSSVLAFALVLGIAPFASAQMRIKPMQPVQSVARPAVANAAVIDRDAVNERRLISLAKKNRLLEGRVATLEAALREMRAAGEYTCSAPSTSRNGRGVTEDCGPYACNYLDGRCRTVAVDSSQCASGYVWENNRCVRPPPPAPDDDCFIGLFC